MIEIPSVDSLDRGSEAELVDKLWHECGARFALQDDRLDSGHSPLYYEIWCSPDYPSLAIVLVSIDTGSSAYQGPFREIECHPFVAEDTLYRLTFSGRGYRKVIRRYLMPNTTSGEWKWAVIFAAADRRLLSDLFDPDGGIGRIQIGG